MLILKLFLFLFVRVSATAESVLLDQDDEILFYEEVVRSIIHPEEYLTKPKRLSGENTCKGYFGLNVCLTATALENHFFDKPSEEERVAYRSKDKVICRCERFADCYYANPCARSAYRNHTLEICHLYRQVVETMSSCLTMIKNNMSVYEWNTEEFVGPMGLFRQEFNFFELWDSWYAYHPFRCDKLRGHLRKFRGLITETCGEPMWKQYHWHVNATNTFPGLCLIENLDD